MTSRSCALAFSREASRHRSSWPPRERLFFELSRLKCGIVTCGELCPGLNDVIRAIVVSLRRNYDVRVVYGFQFDYEGLIKKHGHALVELTVDTVRRIHEMGGTVLGSSRGMQSAADTVDTLVRMEIGLLFTLGGDGTLRGAHAIAEEVKRRGLKIGVVSVPKTIDNDISYIEASFGFETAVAAARHATPPAPPTSKPPAPATASAWSS